MLAINYQWESIETYILRCMDLGKVLGTIMGVRNGHLEQIFSTGMVLCV